MRSPVRVFRYDPFCRCGCEASVVTAVVAESVSSPYAVCVSEHAALRRRGRPRSEKAHHAILATARTLLVEEGLQAMTLDRIAREAHVAKTTIYRWWDSKELLALDAAFAEIDRARVSQPVDTGSLRGDMLARWETMLRFFAEPPWSRVMTSLLAHAQLDAAFAAIYRERFFDPRRDAARASVRAAIARGELGEQTDIELALDLFFAPFWNRLLHGHAPLNERYGRQVVDATIRALAPDRPAHR
jgi:AcrR family transcriptional regulator